MVFDNTITLGAVIELAGLLVTATGFFVVLDQRSKKLEEKTDERHKINEARLASVEGEMKQQTQILIAIARQDERLRYLEARIEILRQARETDKTARGA